MYLQEDTHRKIQQTKRYTNEINKNIEQFKNGEKLANEIIKS